MCTYMLYGITFLILVLWTLKAYASTGLLPPEQRLPRQECGKEHSFKVEGIEGFRAC